MKQKSHTKRTTSVPTVWTPERGLAHVSAGRDLQVEVAEVAGGLEVHVAPRVAPARAQQRRGVGRAPGQPEPLEQHRQEERQRGVHHLGPLVYVHPPAATTTDPRWWFSSSETFSSLLDVWRR